ncbi:Predicted amidohydrolase [Terribacillus halophilus]|uniref:Predicted amidohydrolase n=1 Tax=Terribacillus halophilus TaxID=361279 RepID=A0A1G6RT57_9BACI|nr:carbon-nitrogen family hydrolase [Terribacillus halophilus]SDD07136.1 Predicted amidohydrolase [Terribacillus halophilus]
MKLALIQHDIVFGNPEANYRKMEALINEAQENADVIVLPELWTTGYDLTRLDSISDKEGETTRHFIRRLAKTHQIYIVAGSIAKRTETGVYNTMLVYGPAGELLHEYDKAHLFRLMDEEKFLSQGDRSASFSIGNKRAAGVICYDIRFPEFIRTHMTGDQQVLFVVAEWPKQRLDHWRALLLSRAIENQCFVVACNRSGSDPANDFAGHSLIIGPWGEIIAEAKEEATILYGEADLDQVADVRNRIPVFQDRRPSIYDVQ